MKNRAPAAIQITAEQMLLEAQARAPNYASDIGKQVITGADELDDVRMRKRKEFEDLIRRYGVTLGFFVNRWPLLPPPPLLQQLHMQSHARKNAVECLNVHV